MLKSFIGIDIGTTVSKGVLLSETGELLHEYQMQHMYSDERDYAECWWEESCTILRNLIANLKNESELVSITVSAMAPNLIMLDDSGNIVDKTVLFTDDFAISKQQELDIAEGTKWKNETLSKLIILKKQSTRWKSVRKVLTTHCFIGYRLTGSMYCDTATAYEYGNVFDDQLRIWNEKLLCQHKLTPSIFPELVSPISTVGKVSKDIAKLLGISTDVIVVAGSHDSIASMIGAGLFQKDDQLIYYGTFNCSAVIRESIPDILLGNTSKSPIEWTSSIPDSGPQFTAMCKLLLGEENYAKFDEMALMSSPGANGIIFLQNPQLMKTSISSKSSGFFCNLSKDISLSDMCRAVYESFPYGVHAFWETLNDFNYPKECYAAGGGTRSKVRMQIVSDILGIEQYKLKHAENAVGTALIGMASYDFNNFFTVQRKRKNHADKIVNTSKHDELYKEALCKYRTLLSCYNNFK